MKKINVSGDNSVLTIKNDESIVIHGENENLVLEIRENINAKITLENTKIKKLECIIKENSLLDIDIISAFNTKVSSTFNLYNNSKLNLKVIASSEYWDETIVNLNNENAKFEGKYCILNKNVDSLICTTVQHNAPKTYSNITNYGIVFDNSKISFTTIGKIENGMGKSVCKQLSRGIIIGNNAIIKIKPILLIDEYDVYAKHGAVIGKMSSDELLYLMSRGINNKEATHLVISSIVNPFLETLLDQSQRKNIEETFYRLF